MEDILNNSALVEIADRYITYLYNKEIFEAALVLFVSVCLTIVIVIVSK